ncbi:hypothetical protein ACIA5G_08985 [Amycolatopsis sp. NPDC051758]|uniref:hypothetical protein n=1 Tax=Amycolatopsis sp. NPDC051758 TaxID=3363935 RepID=UPI00378E13A9
MSISDWKRTIYAILALPACLGGPEVRRRLARRCLGAEPRRGAVLASAAAFPIAALIWFLVWRITTYGLFWDDATANESWGGPSLAGAWIVHFFCALGMAVPCMWLLRPLTRRQVRTP